MRNVGNNHASTAIEAPAAAMAVLALILAAGFGIASGCGKHKEPVLQGDAKKDSQNFSVQPSVMTDVPLPGR